MYNNMEYKMIIVCTKVGSVLPNLSVYRTVKLFCCERYTIMEFSTVGLPHMFWHGIVLYVFFQS